MTDRLTAACSNYDVVKDRVGNGPPTKDFKGSCCDLSQSARVGINAGSALARDKLLQLGYRHNDCNDCTSLAFCFDGNLKQ